MSALDRIFYMKKSESNKDQLQTALLYFIPMFSFTSMLFSILQHSHFIPLKTPENLWFSGVFRGYKMGMLQNTGMHWRETLLQNELMQFIETEENSRTKQVKLFLPTKSKRLPIHMESLHILLLLQQWQCHLHSTTVWVRRLNLMVLN